MEEANELAQQLLRHLEEGLEGLWIHTGELGILSLETMLAKSAPLWSRRRRGQNVPVAVVLSWRTKEREVLNDRCH